MLVGSSNSVASDKNETLKVGKIADQFRTATVYVVALSTVGTHSLYVRAAHASPTSPAPLLIFTPWVTQRYPP